MKMTLNSNKPQTKFKDINVGDIFVWTYEGETDMQKVFRGYSKGIKLEDNHWYSFDDAIIRSGDAVVNNDVMLLKIDSIEFSLA